MLSLLLLSMVSFPMTSCSLPGQLPLIVQNPDTLDMGGTWSGGSVSLAAIDGLEGGRFGAAVINLRTGSTLASTGHGVYPLDDPDPILLAFAVELMESGDFPPDSLVGRNFTIKDEFLRAFHGSTEAAARAMWAIGLESLSAWADVRGFSDTELHDVQLEWEGAPVTSPSMTSLSDLTDALEIIASGMDIPAVREIMADPDLGDGQAASVGEGWDMYGWVDAGTEHKTFMLIAESDSGEMLGLVLLCDDLCCEEKADLALMLMWQAVTGG
jgi:hypothetical protein